MIIVFYKKTINLFKAIFYKILKLLNAISLAFLKKKKTLASNYLLLDSIDEINRFCKSLLIKNLLIKRSSIL